MVHKLSIILDQSTDARLTSPPIITVELVGMSESMQEHKSEMYHVCLCRNVVLLTRRPVTGEKSYFG